MVRFAAVCSDHILAFCFQTHVIKDFRVFSFFLISQHIATEAALFAHKVSLVLFTVLSGVVGYNSASMAKNCFTGAASNPVPAHVDGSSWRHDISCIIFCVVINLTLSCLHHCSALALNNIISLTHKCIQLALLNFLQLFSRKIVFLLGHSDYFATIWFWASHEAVHSQGKDGCLFETIHMHRMEAISRL